LSTFVFPDSSNKTTITIEFCDRSRLCRLHRATWIQTELCLTFPSPAIESIILIPLNADETAGRFRVWLSHGADLGAERAELMWDRKTEGGFPELKTLKQRIRDKIQPGKSLGHSDKKSE
ncbi:hypothetical protein M378DRAFT_72565, partial [Amanita muscaria Koide BX008]